MFRTLSQLIARASNVWSSWLRRIGVTPSVEPPTPVAEADSSSSADIVASAAGPTPMGSRQFVVVLRGPSAAAFEEDDGIVVQELNSAKGPIRLHFRTRWLTPSSDVKMAGHIWLEATGQAASIDEAIDQFSRSALVFVPVIAFAANAAIDDCEFELAFDSTPGVTERDYFQSHVPGERGLPRCGRRIDPIATVGLFEAVQSSPHRERVLRAINQYGLALQAWRLGYESLTVAHLWMAAEALTKAVVRAEALRRGLAMEGELAIAMGIDLKRLDSAIRRSVIFQGDDECYEDGKTASDGLEHGFLGFDEIRAKSSSVRNRMAALIRDAVITLIEVPENVAVALKRDPFDEPLGNWPMSRFIRGKLIGKGDQLAAEGNVYPICVWSVSVKKTTPSGEGRVDAEFSESMTPQLAPGISFKPVRHEVWGR